MAKPLRIGMIGYGFMGRAHSNGYNRVKDFFDLEYLPVLQAVAARDADKAQAFADRWGYARVETDWQKLVAADDIDAVDICTPNNLHAEIAIEAAKHGKAILCEKPLSMDTAEGERMCAAVEQAGVPNTVWYNYRRIPAVTFAKQLINADLPQGGAALWRLDAKAAGSGVTGDLLAHCIDTAIWLNGQVKDVTAMTETFVKERVHQLTGKVEPVEIDDACSFLCHFANGSLGLFESTRYARGHKALYTFEINGEHMSLKWDLHDLHRLQVYDHKDAGPERGWKSVHVTDGDHPYMDKWWVPGLAIGYEHSFVHQVADFLEAYARKQPCHPTFRDALETQKVCDAVLKSAKSHQWAAV
jgi:predicted dehydrogenase